MLRPNLILAVAVLLLLSGCASSQTGSLAPEATIAKPAQATSTPGQARAPQTAPAPAHSGDFIDKQGRLLPEFEQFAQETAADRGLDLAQARSLLGSARRDDTAIKLMTPTKSGRIRRAWASYRQRHVDPIRIRLGVKFWQDNQAMLRQTASASGVPAEIIVAIIGIETVYGRYTGNHRVLDVLATLGFRYPDAQRPERQAMFRRQLADLLQLHQDGWLDAASAQGSFAGAMGLAQFMPGSLLNYAADGDGDGRIDLANSSADAIASVASFLRQHGWQPGVPVFLPARLPANAAGLAQDGLEPINSWAQLEAAAVRALPGFEPAWQRLPMGVIDLRDEIRNTHDTRLASPNFFAITHYNRSYFYAASVADLAAEIAQRMAQ